MKPFVKLFNMVVAEDIITKEGRVYVIMTNWAFMYLNWGTPLCMDPNVIQPKAVVKSCGHNESFCTTSYKRLNNIGMIDKIVGMKVLDMNMVESTIVLITREIVFDVIVTIMEILVTN